MLSFYSFLYVISAFGWMITQMSIKWTTVRMCLLTFTHKWKYTIYVCKKMVSFCNSKCSYANVYGLCYANCLCISGLLHLRVPVFISTKPSLHLFVCCCQSNDSFLFKDPVQIDPWNYVVFEKRWFQAKGLQLKKMYHYVFIKAQHSKNS